MKRHHFEGRGPDALDPDPRCYRCGKPARSDLHCRRRTKSEVAASEWKKEAQRTQRDYMAYVSRIREALEQQPPRDYINDLYVQGTTAAKYDAQDIRKLRANLADHATALIAIWRVMGGVLHINPDRYGITSVARIVNAIYALGKRQCAEGLDHGS